MNAYDVYTQHNYVQFDDVVYLDINSQTQVDDLEFIFKYHINI